MIQKELYEKVLRMSTFDGIKEHLNYQIRSIHQKLLQGRDFDVKIDVFAIDIGILEESYNSHSKEKLLAESKQEVIYALACLEPSW